MDRNKMNFMNKNPKKMSILSNELFALGSKSNRDESKNKIIPVKNPNASLDRKRESSSIISHAPKKQKLSINRTGADGGMGSSHELWEQMATDCDPIELIDTLYTAIDQKDTDTVLRLLCGSIRQLAHSRSKFDSVLYLALFYISKVYPSYFCNDIVTSALIYILRRDCNIKCRQSSQSQALAANLLAKSYDERIQWPESFVRTFIDDAINERVWTDNDFCAPFIQNICTVFQTRIPQPNIVQSDAASGAAGTSQQHRETIAGADEDSGDNSVYGDLEVTTRNNDTALGSDVFYNVQNRYSHALDGVSKYVIEAIKEQLNKRQQQDCYTRNLIKFLCSMSGLGEVRYLSISRLELWIHNGKLVKLAQQLLSYICRNIKSQYPKDQEVLAMLIKMRLKTKPLINYYMACLKEMITIQPDILSTVLKLVVQNELSNTRNPNNMGMLATMFQTSPEPSAIHLAEIYKEFLLQRDDCLRTLRVFLRELIRLLRFDMHIVKFCKVFLNEKHELTKQIEHSEIKERIFYSMVDITCLCMLLCISPQVREASVNIRTNRDVKLYPVLSKFYQQISQIQLDIVLWMYETVPTVYKPQNLEYSQALHKILLLENPEQYSRSDQWPAEPERAVLFRIISETPIHEETLLRIILIGITKEIPFSIPDTIDILMMVIKRASAMRTVNYPVIQTNKFDIIDFLFSMAEYHHPENIKLPVGYDPPKLAITVLYWKVWLIMLMISAHNPMTFGAFCWDHYPTMKILIEMCITNQFNETQVSKEELQVMALERDHILEFESYLAAQTSQAVITEENAILISQLMLMDPMGASRKIPTAVLDQLKYLNKNLRIGHLLCRSRKPDLLLDIIQRYGTTQSMPWLSDLVQNNEGDFSHLPVQCLCEFLLFNANVIKEDNGRDAELVNFLRNLILEPESNKQTVCEVLDYIFRRLSSTLKQSRSAALKGIKIIFKNPDLKDSSWLLQSIPEIAHFKEARSFIIPQLRAACQVENSPQLLMSYIQFIAAHTLSDTVVDMLEHVTDMAQLIVERSTIFQHIIPSADSTDSLYENRFQTLKCLFVMFNNYIIKLREYSEPYEWTQYPDLLMVQFEDGIQLPLHLNIIHAFIILLIHSSNILKESTPILDYWFPPGHTAPNAYLPSIPGDTVQLLPDWLKLKMIRSSVDRLIEAALHNLNADQIVLFVQNFGTPVNSMSKLLAILDHAVIEEFDAVKGAILNKAYLAQLIEIQQARGAKNGHFTVQALGLHSHSQTVPDRPKHDIPLIASTYLESFTLKPISSREIVTNVKDVDENIELILVNSNLGVLNSNIFRKFTHTSLNRLSSDTSYSMNDEILVENHALIHLFRFINRSKISSFYQNMPQYHQACTFFRTLLLYKCESIEDDKLMSQFLIETKTTLSSMDIESFKTHPMFYTNICNMIQSKEFHQVKRKNNFDLLPNISFNRADLEQIYTQFNLDTAENIAKNIENKEVLCRNGPLVDWLAVVDPEFTILNENAHKIILFSKKYNDFRFFLLSLNCHQSNWDTLISTLDYLLSKKCETNFDCSTVLNFIEALLNNSKLWQGRDKSLSSHAEPDNMFCLNAEELSAFTKFILREAETEVDYNSAQCDYKLCARIKLLFRVTNKNKANLVKLCEFVSKNCTSTIMRGKVLQQMYLMCPSVKFFRRKLEHEHATFPKSLKGYQADKVSNYLITCLANLFLKKDFEALSSDTELLIRKLAASHPALFLRQLGVLSSLIQGKSQITLRALREEYHFHRFIQILRTLELLQPMLFEDTYRQELNNSLECYFTFLKHHCNAKETFPILIKFVELLQAYINLYPANALAVIEKYVGILIELAAKFNSIIPLHQLVQEIALLQPKTTFASELNDDEIKQEFDLEEQTVAKASSSTNVSIDAEIVDGGTIFPVPQLDICNRGLGSFPITYSYNKSSHISPHFMNLIKIVKHSSSEDALLGPLQEIESLTSRRFSFLAEIFDRLLELIFSSSAQIRSNAFILLIRHLKHNPGRSDINRCTLNAYIQCLCDDNSSVASTAVDNLTEMALLLQEYAIEILTVSFSLGIQSRLNTCTQIKRALQTMLLQYGY